MARDHRKLDAFLLADELVLVVYRVTAALPKSETFGLQSQIRRAAVSAPTNIVEGCSRDSEADYLRFLEIALGSARETQYLLGLARRLSLLAADATRPLEDQCARVIGTLINLRRSLKGRSAGTVDGRKP